LAGLDRATGEALLARVRFYRDLGLTEFYRRPVDPALLAQLSAEAAALDAAPIEDHATQHPASRSRRHPRWPLLFLLQTVLPRCN
jgi:hypothetical protein